MEDLISDRLFVHVWSVRNRLTLEYSIGKARVSKERKISFIDLIYIFLDIVLYLCN